MEVVDLSSFHEAMKRKRLEQPKEYFARVLALGPAQRHAWVRDELSAEWSLVRAVWQDGDELWEWQSGIGGGAVGLAVIRNGSPVQVWFRHRAL